MYMQHQAFSWHADISKIHLSCSEMAALHGKDHICRDSDADGVASL